MTMLSTSPEQIAQLARQWLEWDQNTSTANEIKNLLGEKDYDALQPLLTQRLAFGTAGLRGKMGPGFNRMNDLVILQTTQGFTKYLLSQNFTQNNRGVVIGYDNRHNSRRFAEIAASVFLHAEIPVFLYSQICPTPYVPFAVKHLRACGGVMITASHNPKEDNGYKVYWSNGAQIMSPRDKQIQSAILENLAPWAPASGWDTSVLVHSKLLSDPLPAVGAAYMHSLAASWLLPKQLILKPVIDIVYTPLHGVGQQYVTEAFRSLNITPLIEVEEQSKPDPEFPTVKFPNPEEGKECLTLSIKKAEVVGATVILANDPDADRFAMAEKQRDSMGKDGEWYVFTGNEIASLLGSWLWKMFRARNPDIPSSSCYMLASTVSSKFLRSFCQQERLNFVETLTGFKYMGNKADELEKQDSKNHIIFAFEEAIGYMCGTHVLDKDGITACVVAQQMCAEICRGGPSSLKNTVDQLYDKYGQHVGYNSYYFCHEPKTIERIFNRIRNWPPASTANVPSLPVPLAKNQTYPSAVDAGNIAVVHVRDLTSGYDSRMPNGVPDLPVSRSSQMITLFFANGVEMTLRTSGTEPKIKFYSELIVPPGGNVPSIAVADTTADARKTAEQQQSISGGSKSEKKSQRDLLHEHLVAFVNRVNAELLEPTQNGLEPSSGISKSC